MPLRMDFFEQPLFRLTQPSSLNDPFDSKPTKEAIRKKIAFLTDDYGEGAGYISDDEINHKHGSIKEELEGELEKFGIISLTENPHSLLMWSHYANEHKGIVVELFNSDEIFHFSNSGVEDSRIAERKPVRVMYDSRRPGLHMPHECIHSIYEDDFFRHIAFVKSDDWMYEKEHRFLLPLSEADVAILKADYQHLSKSDFDIHLKQREIQFKGGPDVYTFENEDLNCPFRNVQKVRYDDSISSNGQLMLFKRVKPDAIRAIYFGCRVPDQQISEAIKMCKQNKNFSSNLIFYKAFEDQDRFEVYFKMM